jgi:hypothetical protein
LPGKRQIGVRSWKKWVMPVLLVVARRRNADWQRGS